jgi:hypothetical protein
MHGATIKIKINKNKNKDKNKLTRALIRSALTNSFFF